MKHWLSLILALAMALALTGCAPKQPGGENAGPAAAATEPANDEPKPAEPAETWDYDLATETASEEYRADDGTVLATWSYEQPILRLKNSKGGIFDGAQPSDGATQEQFDVCKAFNDAVSADVSASREAFGQTKAEAKEQYEWKTSQGMEFMPLVDEVTVGEIYRGGDLLSVAAQRYVNLGGAHPDWMLVNRSFDLAEGKPVTPASLSDDPARLCELISNFVINSIYEDGQFEGYCEDLDELIRAKTDFDAYFNEYGMTVCFEEYEIAPHALGVPEFTVPRERIASALNERGERLLRPSAEEKALGDYYEADELWYWCEGGIPADYENLRTERIGEGDDAFDVGYARVAVPGVTTLADLRALLEKRFTTELVDEKLAPCEAGYGMFREFDGVLYTAMGDRGTDMYIQSVDYRAELNDAKTGGKVVATIQWQDYDETKEEWVQTEQTEVDFPFELTGDGARFSQFNAIY